MRSITLMSLLLFQFPLYGQECPTPEIGAEKAKEYAIAFGVHPTSGSTDSKASFFSWVGEIHSEIGTYRYAVDKKTCELKWMKTTKNLPGGDCAEGIAERTMDALIAVQGENALGGIVLERISDDDARKYIVTHQWGPLEYAATFYSRGAIRTYFLKFQEDCSLQYLTYVP